MWITLRLNATVQSPADGGDPENESQNDVSFSSSPLVVVDSGFAGDRVGVQLPSARGRFYSYLSDALSAACGARRTKFTAGDRSVQRRRRDGRERGTDRSSPQRLRRPKRPERYAGQFS